MTISELQKEAKRGDRFYAFTANGRRFLCEWFNPEGGLYYILESDTGPLRKSVLVSVEGAANARAEAI